MTNLTRTFLLLSFFAFFVFSSCEEDVELTGAPTIELKSPQNESTGVNVSPSFSWLAKIPGDKGLQFDRDKKVLKYDFYIGTDASNLELKEEDLTESIVRLNLSKNATYFWKVIAKNDGATTESPVWSLSTELGATVPVAILPLDNSNVRGNADGIQIFEWSGISLGAEDTVKYELLLGEDNPPTTVVRDITITDESKNSTEIAFSLSTLTNQSTYYWQIKSKGELSEVFSFTKLGVGFPDITVLSEPANSSSQKNNPLLKWWKTNDPEGDEITYDVYLDKVNPPVALVASVTDTVYKVSGTDPETDYYWRIVAKDPKGNSTSSEVFTFFKEKVSIPEAPVLEDLSTDGLYKVGEELVFTLDDESISSYDVYVDTVNPPVTKVDNSTSNKYEIKSEFIPSRQGDVKTYYVSVVAKNDAGDSPASNVIEFQPEMSGTYTDVRGDETETYTWIRLGKQVWMTQNLRTTKFTDGTDMTDLAGGSGSDNTIALYDTMTSDLFTEANGFPAGYMKTSEEWLAERGRVYNHVVANSELTAPKGWHVMSGTDMFTLSELVGPEVGEAPWPNAYFNGSANRPNIAAAIAPALNNGNDTYGINYGTAGWRTMAVWRAQTLTFNPFWTSDGSNGIFEMRSTAGNYTRYYVNATNVNELTAIRLLKD